MNIWKPVDKELPPNKRPVMVTVCNDGKYVWVQDAFYDGNDWRNLKNIKIDNKKITA